MAGSTFRVRVLGALGAVVLLIVATLALATGAGAKPPPVGDGKGGVKLKRIGNFDEPVYTATAPGKASKKLLFVVERHGTVQVVKNGRVLDKPFIDVGDELYTEFLGNDFNERGLLSIAFDPGYAKNGRFYLYYTAVPAGDVTVAQYERKPNRAVVADPDSGREVISIPHSEFPNHNGGQVSFGPDGNMWLATGDGGFACDPHENAQNLDSLLGKLLRITPQPNGGYTVPAGNPLVGGPGADEIYSYGLRNPFRFSFDAKAGTISIADVGQDQWEEINHLKTAKAKGANFGWDGYEGLEPLVLSDFCLTGGGFTDPDTPSPLPPDSTFPILAFPHVSDDPDQYTGCAVIGGPVVSDRRLRSVYGRYLYSDSCNGGIQSMVAKPSGAKQDRPLGVSLAGPSSITQVRGNKVYATSLAGPVYRLEAKRRGGAKHNRGAARREPASERGALAFRAAKLGDFDQPVYVSGPPRSNGLRFVVEKTGKVIAVGRGGKQSTFLDLRRKVRTEGEEGLLSIAFDPAYRQNRLFYVYYTDKKRDIVVAEYKRSAKNPRRANKKSGRRVISVRHRLNDNHNGGTVQFGPDGYLYLATGDGGSGGDPDENAQNLRSLLGKLLRIDPHRSGKQRYTIPADNPFVGRFGTDEIYSYGLRNPFRFSFDSESGDLSIGDVGQESWEEVNHTTLAGAKGANFGWDAYEGLEPYDSSDASPIPPEPVTFPIHVYSHGGGNCAITGGYVSHDPKTPGLEGRYIYADYCKGQIRSLLPTAPASDDRAVPGLPSASVSGFGTDAKGAIYFTDLAGGGVYRIAPAS